MPGTPLTHHSVGSTCRSQPTACARPALRSRRGRESCRSDAEFDTSHPARDNRTGHLRLPFPKFHCSTYPGRETSCAAHRDLRAAGSRPVVGPRRPWRPSCCSAAASRRAARTGPSDTLDAFLAGWQSGDLTKVGFVDRGRRRRSPPPRCPTRSTSLSGDLPQASLLITAVGEPKVTGEIAVQPGEAGLDAARRRALVVPEHRADDRARQRRLAGGLGAGHRAQRADRRRPARVAPGAGRSGPASWTPPASRSSRRGRWSPSALDPADASPTWPALTKSLDTAFKKVGVTVDLKDLKSRMDKAPGPGRPRRRGHPAARGLPQDPRRGTPAATAPSSARSTATSRRPAQFARALLGTVDPATREDIDANPDTVAPGRSGRARRPAAAVRHQAARHRRPVRGDRPQGARRHRQRRRRSSAPSRWPARRSRPRWTSRVQNAADARGGRREAAQRAGRHPDQRLVGARGRERPGRRHASTPR